MWANFYWSYVKNIQQSIRQKSSLAIGDVTSSLSMISFRSIVDDQFLVLEQWRERKWIWLISRGEEQREKCKSNSIPNCNSCFVILLFVFRAVFFVLIEDRCHWINYFNQLFYSEKNKWIRQLNFEKILFQTREFLQKHQLSFYRNSPNFFI